MVTRVATLTALAALTSLPSLSLAQASPRGYQAGDARGVVYGAELLGPIYATPLERAGGGTESLGVGAGAGVRLRVGYELPAGLQLELYGGFAASELAAVPMEDPSRSHALVQAEVRLGLRYSIYTGTPIVPFARLGGGVRVLLFTWGSDAAAGDAGLLAFDATVGAQIAIAPFFGVELGATVDYTLGLSAFEAGFWAVTPFVGVSLYLYDERDPITAP